MRSIATTQASEPLGNGVLSSEFTFLCKFLLPLFVPIFGAGFLALWFTAPAVGQRPDLPWWIKSLSIAAWIAASYIVGWIYIGLKRVRIFDGHLLVSNYVSE